MYIQKHSYTKPAVHLPLPGWVHHILLTHYRTVGLRLVHCKLSRISHHQFQEEKDLACAMQSFPTMDNLKAVKKSFVELQLQVTISIVFVGGKRGVWVGKAISQNPPIIIHIQPFQTIHSQLQSLCNDSNHQKLTEKPSAMKFGFPHIFK